MKVIRHMEGRKLMLDIYFMTSMMVVYYHHLVYDFPYLSITLIMALM